MQGWWTQFRLRLWALWKRRQLDRDLAEEIEFHLAERARRGRLQPYQARQRFGNPTVYREEIRDMWTFRWLEALGQDLRYAGRTMRANPGFALVAVLTLALGIGANTAIFSVVDAVILRPLPYHEPERLVELWGNVKRAKVERRGASYPDFLDWREQSRSFEGMAGGDTGTMTITGVDEPERITGEVVSQPYFDLLGVRPAMGRVFRPEEDQVAQRDAVVVLSDALWKRRFGGARDVVGKTVQLDGRPYQITGVMPEWFRGVTDQAEAWIPTMMAGTAQDFAERGTRGMAVLARLKPGVSVASAQAELDGICKRLEQAYPGTNSGRGVEVSPLDRELFGEIRKPLLVLLCAVGFVLLIACTNVANLVLARNEARQHEIAMRVALGAGRGRVLMQLMVESGALAVLGAGLGLLAARWGVKALMAASPVRFPSFIQPGVDLKVALFLAGVTCLCGLALGLIPAMQARGGSVADSLKGSSGRVADSRGGARVRRVLVVTEVAFAALLLVGAGLMMRTMGELSALHPGYEIGHVLTMRVALPRLAPRDTASTGAAGPADARTVITASEVLRHVMKVASVETVALGNDTPLSGGGAVFFTAEGQPPATSQTAPRAYLHRVTPEFFRVFRIPFRAGRTFTEQEMRADLGPVIVTEALVKRFWPGQDPIGRRIRGGGSRSTDPWMTIVGVVNDMKYRNLPENPTGDPDIFLPFSERQRTFALVVRSAGNPAKLGEAVRRAVREADRTAVIYRMQTLEELASRETAQSRFTGWLMGIFAVAALALAVVGIYGVMSYSVMRRTQEIGIRMALGAARGDVMRMILRGGMLLAGSGLLLGLGAAAGLVRGMETLLWGVRPLDPVAFVAAALALGVTALAACLIPAARATRVAPSQALRNE